MTTKTKRAAALGYSLSFLLVLPVADGTIGIADAGHALSAYSITISTSVLPAIFESTTEDLRPSRTTTDLRLNRTTEDLRPSRTTEGIA